jgi:hypothetical protein
MTGDCDHIYHDFNSDGFRCVCCGSHLTRAEFYAWETAQDKAAVLDLVEDRVGVFVLEDADGEGV